MLSTQQHEAEESLARRKIKQLETNDRFHFLAVPFCVFLLQCAEERKRQALERRMLFLCEFDVSYWMNIVKPEVMQRDELVDVWEPFAADMREEAAILREHSQRRENKLAWLKELRRIEVERLRSADTEWEQRIDQCKEREIQQVSHLLLNRNASLLQLSATQIEDSLRQLRSPWVPFSQVERLRASLSKSSSREQSMGRRRGVEEGPFEGRRRGVNRLVMRHQQRQEEDEDGTGEGVGSGNRPVYRDARSIERSPSPRYLTWNPTSTAMATSQSRPLPHYVVPSSLSPDHRREGIHNDPPHRAVPLGIPLSLLPLPEGRRGEMSMSMDGRNSKEQQMSYLDSLISRLDHYQHSPQ